MQLSQFQKGLIFVLILLFFLGGLLFINRLILADAFSKEEAQHALYSAWLNKDMRALDWGSFWYDTQRQMFWPFFHSWLQASFFLFTGVNYIGARCLSFLFFLATVILIYLLGVRFSPKDGWKIGALAAALTFLSPIMLRFAVENTLEGMGALIFIGAFYLYTYCEECELALEYVLLAALLGISIFTNYLYAYLMLPAFIVMTLGKLGPIFVEVTSLHRKGEKAAYPFMWWAYRKLIVLAILVACIATWFLSSTFSRKIMLLLQAIFRYSGGELVSGIWATLFYYPQAIISHYFFSPWLGLLAVLSLLIPLIGFKYRWIGRLYTFAWTVILLATLTVPSKAPQFIYIIAPFIMLIMSGSMVYLFEHYRQWVKVGLAVIILPALFSLPNLTASYLPAQPRENMITVLNFFRQNLLPRYPVASSVNLQHLNPEGITFHYWGWNAPVLADPTFGEEELFRLARYFLVVDLAPNSLYQAEVLDDSGARWNTFLLDKLRTGDVREYTARHFGRIGVTARIFEKTMPESPPTAVKF